MEKLIMVPPPLVALALFGLALGLDRTFPGLPSVRHVLTGIVLMSSGGFLALSALGHFRALQTTFVPHGEPSALVTLGPYVWTRNPMYLGLVTALLGIALYFGQLPFLLVPPSCVWVLNRVHIPHEEAKLGSLFGASYQAYRQRVPRWL